MMDKYRKNFILCDSAVYYCLLCDELLKGIPNVEKHMRWENHRKSLKNQACFPRFRKDLIYKVENHFYCEMCNFVVSDIDAVTKHINNEGHKAMKNNPKTETRIIGQFDDGFIVINKLKLDMAHWNSIVDKNCLVCNIEVKNINFHMELKEHIINLINTKTKCENQRYYREINDDKYHCFSCKKVFPALEFNNHWLSCENNDLSEIKTQKEVEPSKNIGNSIEGTAKEDEVHDQLLDSLQDFYLVDRKENTATCKQCRLVIAINFRPIMEHMKIHKQTEGPKTNPNKAEDSEPHSKGPSDEKVVYREITDFGKRRSELAKYGKEHSIKLNFNSSKGWCLICDRYMYPHKNNFKQHIEGATHQGNLELEGLTSPKNHDSREIKTKSILQCRLEYLLRDEKFYIFDYLSIDVFSFFLLRQIEDPHLRKTKCYACNELLPQGKEWEHCVTPKHKTKFLAAKFVVSCEESQFIREIRRNYFHCGFCNKTFPFSEQLFAHMVSRQHAVMRKRKSGIRLGSIKLNTKSDDVYTKLVRYGFGKH